MRPFLLYAVLRLGLWAVIWWVLTLLDVGVLLAAVLAALIAMLISILFLDRLRDQAAMRWKDARERRLEQRGQPTDDDADYEDQVLDDDAPRSAEGAPDAAAGPAQLPDADPTHGEAPDDGTDASPQDRLRGSDR